MTRTAIRENIFKILFMAEFHTIDEYESQADNYVLELEYANEKEKNRIKEKAVDIARNITELDEIINEYSEGWPTNRLGKAELTIMRLAVYEIKMDESIPREVAINEAVELSKLYGADNAPSFINGVLAKIN